MDLNSERALAIYHGPRREWPNRHTSRQEEMLQMEAQYQPQKQLQKYSGYPASYPRQESQPFRQVPNNMMKNEDPLHQSGRQLQRPSRQSEDVMLIDQGPVYCDDNLVNKADPPTWNHIKR